MIPDVPTVMGPPKKKSTRAGVEVPEDCERKPAPRQPQRASEECCSPTNQTTTAMLTAEARALVREYQRPNKFLVIGSETPETSLSAGAYSPEAVELPEGASICYFSTDPTDHPNWMVVSLKVNDVEMVEGDVPMALSTLAPMLNREDRASPLVGFVWTEDVEIVAELRNISGASAKFRGISIAIIDPDCEAGTSKNIAPAPALAGGERFLGIARALFSEVWAQAKNLFG